jgi:hypothetical protein
MPKLKISIVQLDVSAEGDPEAVRQVMKPVLDAIAGLLGPQVVSYAAEDEVKIADRVIAAVRRTPAKRRGSS